MLTNDRAGDERREWLDHAWRNGWLRQRTTRISNERVRQLVSGREFGGRFHVVDVLITRGPDWATSTWDRRAMRRLSPVIIGPPDIRTRRARYWGL
jgi:hypothetical protein